MVDLLAAAADTYPAEPMRPEQLLAPDGIVIFAKPLPVVWRGDGEDAKYHLAAIGWGESLSTGHGRPFTAITAWHRYTGLRRESSGVSVRYVGLRPQSHSMGAPWIEPTDVGGQRVHIGCCRRFQRWHGHHWCATSMDQCPKQPGGKATERAFGTPQSGGSTYAAPRTPRRNWRRPGQPARPTRHGDIGCDCDVTAPIVT
jgi:hypothetical protein